MEKQVEIPPMPLQGIKVLELGSLIAGPYASALLAQFGAEVIKVEPPKDGDPLRKWRKLHDGTSLWWYTQSRNKKSVTLDLKSDEGRDIVRRMAGQADIVIENFRPGTLEKWGLGWAQLSEQNPQLVMVRISGYGQSGPYRERPGFAAIAECMGGLRHVTGFPDRPPVRVGVSLGDTLASLYGTIGALMAMPALPVFAPAARFQPVLVDDVVLAICAALEQPARAAGQTFELAGPEVLTMLDLNRRIAAATARQPLLIAMPDALSAIFATMTGWLPGAPLSRGQWKLLKAGNVASGAVPGLAELGVQPRPLGLFLDRWMQRFREHGRFGAKVKP